MTNELQVSNPTQAQILEKVILEGDLSKLTSQERLHYYNRTCESLGLNPLTRPFEYVKLNGKLTFYARKEATEQLRKINLVSIIKRDTEVVESIYIVTTWGKTPDGREDVGIGAVSIIGLKGDALANAIMKADTKSKRRLTLSLCGLGFIDESEIETIKDAKIITEAQIEEPMTIENSLFYILESETENELRETFTKAYKTFKHDPIALDRLTKAKEKKKQELTLETQDETVIRDGWPVPTIDVPVTEL